MRQVGMLSERGAMALLAVVLLGGCWTADPTAGPLPGAPDAGPQEDAHDAGPQEPAAACPTGDGGVSFSAAFTVVQPDGGTVRLAHPVYSEVPSPAVLVPGAAADGGTCLYPAVASDGAWVAPGVPEGPVLVRFNEAYVHTTERSLALERMDLGQVELDWSVPAGTALQLEASGLQAWAPEDGLRLVSPNGDHVIEDFGFAGRSGLTGYPPVAGATSASVHVTGFTTLLEGAKGDDLWVQQHGRRPGSAQGGEHEAVVRSFRQPAFSLVPGATVTLAAALAAGPQREVAFRVPTATWEALAQGLRPAASSLVALDWKLAARPGLLPYARLTGGPWLARGVVPTPGGPADAPFRVLMDDGFPEHWLRVGHVSARATALVGGNVPLTLFLARYDTLDALVADATLAPRLGPPRDLRVDGRPAFAGLSGVGTSPELSWEPPALGVPTRYFVQVHVLGSVQRTLRPVLVTSQTRVRLPPELFAGAGGRYVLIVTATRGAGTVNPWHGTLPLDLAQTATGPLTP